jgi:hypothetical protein
MAKLFCSLVRAYSKGYRQQERRADGREEGGTHIVAKPEIITVYVAH